MINKIHNTAKHVKFEVRDNRRRNRTRVRRNNPEAIQHNAVNLRIAQNSRAAIQESKQHDIKILRKEARETRARNRDRAQKERELERELEREKTRRKRQSLKKTQTIKQAL